MIPQKVKYLAWAALHQFGEDSCPSCQSVGKKLPIKRKYAVTVLLECPDCGLRYRFPKMSEQESNRFYQADYAQGFTTDMPSADELWRLKETRFAGTEKDYSAYLGLMNEAGISPGCSVLDFGCSWGYGTWQLMEAGYDVCAYEISKPRADYAARHLGCKMVSNPSEARVSCLFSADVIEHLPDPSSLWRLAEKVVEPNGRVVLFTSDGDGHDNPNYHQLWGLPHPCLPTTRWMDWASHQFGFVGERRRSVFHGELAYVATKLPR
jgi:cyclopropane fatty-acyl-phospholipid synthase-like methyltransferase